MRATRDEMEVMFEEVVFKVSHMFPHKYREDLRQQAWINYPNLKRTFNPEKGTMWTYFWMNTHQYMMNYVGWEKRGYRYLSLDEGLSSNEDEEMTFADIVEDPRNMEEDIMNKEIYDKYMASLHPFQRQAMLLYLEGGYTRMQIQNLLGYTKVTAQRLLQPQPLSQSDIEKLEKGKGIRTVGYLKELEERYKAHPDDTFLKNNSHVVDLVRMGMPTYTLTKKQGVTQYMVQKTRRILIERGIIKDENN